MTGKITVKGTGKPKGTRSVIKGRSTEPKGKLMVKKGTRLKTKRF